jgi:lysophospholipase L1-like esterase
MSSSCPFGLTIRLAAAMVAALLLTPASLLPARAQAQAAAPATIATAQPANPTPSQQGAAVSTTPNQPTSAEPRSLTARAVDTVRQVTRSASDIFNRVPCLPPKGGPKSMGSLPHVAGKLAAGQPVVIVAFGSSSTQGHGASSPEFYYPNRLMAQLRRQYPTAEIDIVNAGVGGEDAPEMMKRMQTAVLDKHPDLVIWQVGTNAVLRNVDPAEIAKFVEEGVARLQAAGTDIVLVDPQYSPAVTARGERASKMVNLLGRVAELRHVGIFPRFEVMRDWHERQAIPVENFVISDGLHMNDWGYACFAQLLGDDIIRSVGQIKLGIHVPADVRTYRPM